MGTEKESNNRGERGHYSSFERDVGRIQYKGPIWESLVMYAVEVP